MSDPVDTVRGISELREALGPADALERCARYAVELARAGAAHDPHLSHVGSARSARHRRAACASCARSGRACSSIAATRCAEVRRVYYRNEPIVDGDGRGRLRRTGHRQSRVSLSLRGAASASVAHAPSAGLHESAAIRRGRALPFVPALRFDVPTNATRGCAVHVLGLLIMQYPTGSPWERVFGWRFLEPWRRSRRTRSACPRAICSSCSRISVFRCDRELAARVPRIDLLLGGHSHDTLEAPEYVGDVPIVHAGPYGRFVSRSELAYDAVAPPFRARRTSRSFRCWRAQRDARALRDQRSRRSGDRGTHRRSSCVRLARRVSSIISRSSATRRRRAMRDVGPRRAHAERRLDRDGKRREIVAGSCARGCSR